MNNLMKQAFRRWDSSQLNEWKIESGFISSPSNESEKILLTADGNIAILSPDNLNIPTRTIRTLEFRCKSDSFTKVTLLWRKDSEDWLVEKKASITLKNDCNWHDYQIELSQIPEWDGTVYQLKMVWENTSYHELYLENIMLTGLYFVPFVFLSGDHDTDKQVLSAVKEAFPNQNKTAVVGFSIHLEYLSNTDKNGCYNLDTTGISNAEYLVSLADEMEMPVCFWLRGDPWGYQTGGIYHTLWADDSQVMWTAKLDEHKIYRNDECGYGYLCLAQQNLDGSKTKYWQQTEKLLGGCSAEIARLLKKYPGSVLAVTTTSEYKFNPKEVDVDLDYNPKTIKEFRDYCKKNFNDDLSAFNRTMELNFLSWEIRFDLEGNEANEGFDPPRRRGTPVLFWQEWARFRGLQIKRAVQNQVNIIGLHLDSKYIYTHQICSPFDPICSPIDAGDIPDSNVGIDMFIHETTKEHLQEIVRFIHHDASRSWGIPEWIPMSNTTFDAVLKSLHRMNNAGIKYLSFLAWGCGEPFEIRNTSAEVAGRQFLKELDASVD